MYRFTDKVTVVVSKGVNITISLSAEGEGTTIVSQPPLQPRGKHMLYVHGKYVYSTLALGKEREIVKEETDLRKEKEAVCCYVHVDVHV